MPRKDLAYNIYIYLCPGLLNNWDSTYIYEVNYHVDK